jgi:hypothetical protein
MCFVIKGWGETGALVMINGQVQKEDENVRLGKINKIDGTDLLVWIKKHSVTPVNIEIKPN